MLFVGLKSVVVLQKYRVEMGKLKGRSWGEDGNQLRCVVVAFGWVALTKEINGELDLSDKL